jgi:uncharacterized protein YndB with AHSA1/START domain
MGHCELHFANTILIRRPVSDVFGYLADFSNIPKWNYAIEESRQSPGPTRIGTTIHQTRSVPSRSEETLRVTEFVPDRTITLGGTLGPFEGVMRYELEPTAEGTRLTNSADLRAGGLLGLAAPLAAGRVSNAVAENLDVLKRLLEMAVAER